MVKQQGPRQLQPLLLVSRVFVWRMRQQHCRLINCLHSMPTRIMHSDGRVHCWFVTASADRQWRAHLYNSSAQDASYSSTTNSSLNGLSGPFSMYCKVHPVDPVRFRALAACRLLCSMLSQAIQLIVCQQLGSLACQAWKQVRRRVVCCLQALQNKQVLALLCSIRRKIDIKHRADSVQMSLEPGLERQH